MKYHTLLISKIRRDVAKFVVCCSCDLVVCCPVSVSVLSLFLAVPWVGVWSMVVAFPGDSHLLIDWSN